VRLTGYWALTEPIYTLSLELLHGVTFALGWAALTRYVHDLCGRWPSVASRLWMLRDVSRCPLIRRTRACVDGTVCAPSVVQVRVYEEVPLAARLLDRSAPHGLPAFSDR